MQLESFELACSTLLAKQRHFWLQRTIVQQSASGFRTFPHQASNVLILKRCANQAHLAGTCPQCQNQTLKNPNSGQDACVLMNCAMDFPSIPTGGGSAPFCFHVRKVVSSRCRNLGTQCLRPNTHKTPLPWPLVTACQGASNTRMCKL